VADASLVHTQVIHPGALGLGGSRPLHLAGELPPPPRLAVVGSRAAHRPYRAAVPWLVRGAGRAGWSVVSGGAVGIDGDAHAAALGEGVPQLVVLPCGPDRAYPPQHAPLFRDVAAAPRSGVLYAHPPGTAPARGMFASRNAVIVALCDAVVVVEASVRSGTMITAALAARRGRPRAIIPGSPGAALLLAQGAHALGWEPGRAEEPAADVEAWLRAVARGEPPAPPPATAWPEHLGWLQQALAEAGAEGLCVESLPSPRTALPALVEAEGRGLVVERAAGRFIAAR
jgi:DNA protecting protein DprA